ncbi:hypothetical protein BCR34DRAFT_606026 [Clohesyomyces aquaticus]|uniref:Reverse transcriptase domain-containing protein n=1 Tax=Clohesyomyces aquaticus TaxID=1231657 RepID=A0A1Y1YT17_9PLEO|nr:hypothetical protein BCR34DRAFT_606026 [Clohesyomyces aquaticus]
MASFARVSLIKKAGTDNEFVAENQDVADELLRAFFPAPPSCEPEDAPSGYSQQLWELIAKDEVKNAVFRASPDKAPGRDGLPVRQIAKVIPLQKPKRGDYTIANNYRPIPLLPRLGKALEQQSVLLHQIRYSLGHQRLLL